MSQEVTQTLAQFAATLTCDRIAPSAREHTKTLLLDALACAFAGHRGEETPQVAAFAQAMAQSRESSVIGGDHASLTGATLLNGFLIAAVTMSDAYRPTMTHVTPSVVPPALAIAERDGCSGADLLAALAAGSEITTRVGLGFDFKAFRARGWHAPGILGPFGAAAATGRLLGLSADQMARAFGLAGSQAAGTYAAWGTPMVKFHQIRGGLSGLMAALLAQQDFVAPRGFLTAADGGLYQAYAEGSRPERAVEELGERWELEQVALRLWPSAATIQGVVTALFALIEKQPLRAQDVRKLRVTTGKTVFDMHAIFPRYQGKFEAMLSSHYAAAAVLHDGALTLDQFEPARYADPLLARFAAEQVECVCDTALTGVTASVEAELADGKKVSARCEQPLGSPENPLSRRQIEDKFRTYARGRLLEANIEKVIQHVAALEQLPSVRTLLDLLRADTPGHQRGAA